MAKCANEKAAMLAAKSNLEQENEDWSAAAIGLGGCALGTIATGIGTGIALVSEFPTYGLATSTVSAAALSTAGCAASTYSSYITLKSAQKEYDNAEAAYDLALSAYCKCIG